MRHELTSGRRLRGSTISMPRCRVTQAASAAIASLVPVSLKLAEAPSATMVSSLPWRSASTTGSVLSRGMRMPCALMTLAIAEFGLRVSSQKNDSLGRPHVELAPLVGKHESPVEILADHEAEQHAGLGLRCHSAVSEFALAVVIGFSAPHARSEGALVALCRGEESHDQRREE